VPIVEGSFCRIEKIGTYGPKANTVGLGASVLSPVGFTLSVTADAVFFLAQITVQSRSSLFASEDLRLLSAHGILSKPALTCLVEVCQMPLVLV